MTDAAATDAAWIRVRGARVHNLQSVDVDLPLGRVAVITGVSGSGKSSLLFDTLYAEGRRRYLTALATPRGGLSADFAAPDVDAIENLPPAICVAQRGERPDRRGNLATLTEIWGLLQVLYARAGVLHCPTCQTPVTTQDRNAIVHAVLQEPERTKILILAPLVRAAPGAHAELLQRIVRDGYVRARVDGELIDVSQPPALAPRKRHTIEVVVDRLLVKDGLRPRLEESLETALALGQGTCVISVERGTGWEDRLWSLAHACDACGRNFPPIDLRTFSLNSPLGVCATCHGVGALTAEELSADAAGAEVVCPECGGQRLGELGRSVRVAAQSLPALAAGAVEDILPQIERWSAAGDVWTTREQQAVAQRILPEITARLRSLRAIGLGYLQLDRRVDTLSTGEIQRARLASALGAELSGALVLLDEPTTGLHPADAGRLLDVVRRVRDQGNTIVMVEHDPSVIAAADWVVEIGPGAGPHGGRVIAAGSPASVLQTPGAATARALRPEDEPTPRREWRPDRWLKLEGCRRHNLQNVALELPLGGLVGVAGVSGSGKSTLLLETLVPAVRSALQRSTTPAVDYDRCSGIEALAAVRVVTGGHAGAGGDASAASLSGVWPELRRLFSLTKDARLRGFSAARFSPRHPEGRCAGCRGRGFVVLDRSWGSALTVPCRECHGRRFNRQTLSVHWRGRSIADVLELSFAAAAAEFAHLPRLARRLAAACELGLGYLQLGQRGDALSGGERQRLELAGALAAGEGAPTLFVLDEASAGLHAEEIRQLTAALRQLLARGHSVVAIDHRVDLLSGAEWLIELGPGAGARGGRIIAAGPLAQVRRLETPTAAALRDWPPRQATDSADSSAQT